MNCYIESQCLRSYRLLVDNYNKLFDRNSCLKLEIQHSQLNVRRNKKLFELRKKSIYDILQCRINREKYHLKKIEQLKCKLCTKDYNINILKHKQDLDKEQIEAFKTQLKLTFEKYQNQFCKNESICECCSNDKCESEELSVDSKNVCRDKSLVDSKCSCDDKSKDGSKCSCEDKSKGGSISSCEDKSVVDSKCSSEDKSNVDSKCSCEDKSKGGSKCSCEDKSKGGSICSCEEKSNVDSKSSDEENSRVHSNCPCADKLLLKNSVEHICEGQIYENVQELLLAIDEYCNSKTLCISILTLLKQSKSNICNLIEENHISRNELTQCQSDLACYVNKLNQEIDMSKKKDCEIYSMYSDNTIMAEGLEKILKEKSYLENQLQQVTEELCSKTKDNIELVNKCEEQKDELKSNESCSDIQICNDECISREVCEKKKTLKKNITIIDGLEYSVCDMKDQLIETEKCKIIFQDKCKHLSIQNEELNNKLEIENYNNIKNCHKIEDLCKRIIQFEAVTKGLEMQNKTHIVEIDELKEAKCVAEKKFNEIIGDLHCTIQELRNELDSAKLDTENTEKCLKNMNEEDKKCFEHKICLLKTDIGNLETELNFYKCKFDSLMTNNLLNEKELSKFSEMVQRLQTREFELNKENEENKEHVSTLCINLDVIKQQLEETIQKNNELKCHNDNLRAKNEVQCQDIDELNNTLICVRKNESCVRKDLIVHKEKLTKADEEIANLNSEMSYVKCDLYKTCAQLACTEQKLQNTECKLNEEICLKEEITEKYSNMVNCLTTNCDMKQSIKPTCISAGCQYDISADDKQLGDYCCFPDENNMPCNITNYDLRGLNYENTYSIKMTKESTNIGIQTNLCCSETGTHIAHCGTVSVIIDESCPNDNVICCPEQRDINKCDFGQCESNDSCTCQCETPPLETTSQIDCHSADCSRSEKSELTTSCDCIAVFLEKENLKCQLAESTHLLEQYGKDAEKKICTIQEEHCKKEFDMNECFNRKTLQYKKDMDELTAQLEECKETILCMENELECCLEREKLLKKDMEKLKEAIKCKNSKISDEEIKMKTMCECLEDCKKQFETMKSLLDLENSTKEELDKQLEQRVVKPQKKIIKKLKTPEKVLRKNKVPKNIKQNVYDPCEDKRLRSGADHDKRHNFRGTQQEMYGRHRGHRFNGYIRDDRNYYPIQVRSDPRGLGYGDAAEHTLPPQFIESLRQQVRKNVGCDKTNCHMMGCCSKLYFRH
ncbi:unnamed protein product [Macrosiphum euphorbiae]|uniref:Uncharacterized protein n=1 Tax=Macrosiphum euphorbiae TaxID=13131 RepID=A0AAV0WMH9_9HEMI|nr:unnamed protein product [Macrosiphum euphorbiae]